MLYAAEALWNVSSFKVFLGFKCFSKWPFEVFFKMADGPLLFALSGLSLSSEVLL